MATNKVGEPKEARLVLLLAWKNGLLLGLGSEIRVGWDLRLEDIFNRLSGLPSR